MAFVDAVMSLGQSVRLLGLVNCAELNGKIGIIKEELSNGRFKISVPGLSNDLSISRRNIKAVHRDEIGGTETNSIKMIKFLSMNPNMNIWQRIVYFYPFGNTPAKNLVWHVPSYQADARFLLLGCGDLRHILHTVWCVDQAGGLAAKQNLDFVVCDIEPSIIARNIILFKLILDDADVTKTWSLFYSLLINPSCIDLLIDCSSNLISLGDTLETWKQTEFGSIIQFCDDHTIRAVRKIWQTYCMGRVSSEKEKEFRSYKQEASDRISQSTILTALKSADPFFLEALKNMKVHSDMAQSFMANGCSQPAELSDSEARISNPLMFRGTEQSVDFHYGLDPACCFHLGLAYAAFKPGSPPSGATPQLETEGPDHRALYEACLGEFGSWCSAFRRAVASSGQRAGAGHAKRPAAPIGTVTIRCFAGDAFDLCQALAIVKAGAGASLHPARRATPVSIAPDVPTEFDLIDTSNVGDSCGLLNVLCACRELMAESPHAVICTETLSTSTKNRGRLDLLLAELLRCDLFTFSAVTGLSLAESATRATANFGLFAEQTLTPEILSESESKAKGAHTFSRLTLRLEWRRLPPAASASRVEMSAEGFVQLFAGIYRDMFRPIIGIVGEGRSLAESLVQLLEDAVVQGQGQNDFALPTAQAFARLVRIALATVQVVGPGAVGAPLLRAIKDTGFLAQSNYMQELFVWFAALGILPVAEFNRAVDDWMAAIGVSWGCPRSDYLGPGRPRTVLVTLLVPAGRAAEAVLQAPTGYLLEMSVRGRSWNCFASFHTLLVKERVSRLLPAPAAATTRAGGPEGRCGAGSGAKGGGASEGGGGALQLQHFTLLEGSPSDHAFVAVTAAVSAVCLFDGDPGSVRVCLGVSVVMARRDPGLARRLGPSLEIYGAALSDTGSVSWSDPERCGLFAGAFQTGCGRVLPALEASPVRELPVPCPSDGGGVNLGGATLSNLRAEVAPAAPRASAASSAGARGVPADLPGGAILSCALRVTFARKDAVAVCTPRLLDMPGPLQARLQMDAAAGTACFDLDLPVSVDLARARIQISRRGGFVNLLLQAPAHAGGAGWRPFCMFADPRPAAPGAGSRQPPRFALFGVPRVLLGAMPAVDVEAADKRGLAWVGLVAGAQLTAAERRGLSAGAAGPAAALASMKWTVHTAAVIYAGLADSAGRGGQSCRLFGLKSPSSGVEVVLFVNGLRLDLCQGSFVLDVAACVLDLSKGFDDVVHWFHDAQTAGRGGSHMSGTSILPVTDDEIVLWKKAFPALCERARNDWEHSSRCEYVSSDSEARGGGPTRGAAAGARVPRSYDVMGAPVVCSCCLGRSVGSELEALAGPRVVRNFFRAAVSPMFEPFRSPDR